MRSVVSKAVILLAVVVTTVYAATRLEFNTATIVSTQPATEQAANKAKILRLTDGTLVVVYGDATGPLNSAWDFDGNLHAAQDIYVTYSRDEGISWSAPQNISLTANLSTTALYDPDGSGATGLGGLPAQPFYGDSSKPNVFAPGNGNNILVTWVDKYCDSGVQGFARYVAPYFNLNPGFIEVPYSCIYAARLKNTASGLTVLAVERLTDGARDAIQDQPRGAGAGFAISWQEDPEGLQPGEAEGPGDGGSGAKVTHGTDIWYSWISTSNFTGGGAWSAPVRISDNETDNVGASRPSLFVGNAQGTPAQAVLAYEETKGLGTIEGKYIIYHVFPFNSPVAAQPGIIVSDPTQNARRPRLVVRGTPGSTHGTRLVFLWRQGLEGQGGPADIMARIGRVPPGTDLAASPDAGWRPQDLDPPVTGTGDPFIAVGNTPALNMSSTNLDDETFLNPIDDARAHRAIIVDDFIALGYVYTPDQAVARYTDLENYDFYVRRSSDGGQTWDSARNLSGQAKNVNVKEPRLVGTPAGVSGSSDPRDVQNEDVYYVVWGTEVNQYEAIREKSINLDLYATRTSDRGDTYESTVIVAEGGVETDDNENGESQLRTTPDGSEVYITWMQTSASATDAVFASGIPVQEAASGGGGGGCSVVPNASFDPVLLLVLAFSILRLVRPGPEVEGLLERDPAPADSRAISTGKQTRFLKRGAEPMKWRRPHSQAPPGTRAIRHISR